MVDFPASSQPQPGNNSSPYPQPCYPLSRLKALLALLSLLQITLPTNSKLFTPKSPSSQSPKSRSEALQAPQPRVQPPPNPPNALTSSEPPYLTPLSRDSLILRSEGTHPLSQKHLISHHLYEVLSVRDPQALVHYNVQMKRVNSTWVEPPTKKNPKFPEVFDVSHAIVVRNFYMGKIEKTMITGIIHASEFFLLNYITRNVRLSFNLSKLIEEYKPIKTEDYNCTIENPEFSTKKYTEPYCFFYDILHHSFLDKTDLIALPFVRHYNSTENGKTRLVADHYIIFMRMVSDVFKFTDIAVKIVKINPIYFNATQKEAKENENSEHASKPCQKISYTGFTSSDVGDHGKRSENNYLVVSRYCKMQPKDSKDKIRNTLQLDKFVISANFEIKSTGSSEVAFLSDHQQDKKTEENGESFYLLKAMVSNPYLFLISKDQIMTLKLEDLLEIVNKNQDLASPQTANSTQLIKGQFEGAFCNFINMKEISCLVQLDEKSKKSEISGDLQEFPRKLEALEGNSTEAFKVFEFVNSDATLLEFDLGVEITTTADLSYSISMKNYIIIKMSSGMVYICYRRKAAKFFIKNDPKEQIPPGYSSCNAFVEESHQAILLREHLFEENYGNELDGYILIGVINYTNSDMGPKKDINFELWLVTGSYFIFSSSLNMTNYYCQTYIEGCANTLLNFIDNRSNKYPISLYMLNSSFSSVLYAQSRGILKNFTDASMQKITLSETYFGDIKDPKLSTDQNYAFKKNSFYSSNSIANFSRPFTFTFDFSKDSKKSSEISPTQLKISRLNWVILELNRDETFSLAAAYRRDGLLLNSESNFEAQNEIKLENEIAEQIVRATSTPIPFSHFNKSLSSDYLSTQIVKKNQGELDTRWRPFLMQTNKYAFDTVSWNRTFDEKKKKWVSEVVVQRHLFEGSNRGRKSSLRLDDINVSSVRPLDSSTSLGVMITSEAFLLFHYEDTSGGNPLKLPFYILSTFKFSEFIMPLTIDTVKNPKVESMNDILIDQNVMILDFNIKSKDEGNDDTTRLICFYNIGADRKSFYAYGYIDIHSLFARHFPNTSANKTFVMHFSKRHDKAILIFESAKCLFEFSLNRLFLEGLNLGQKMRHNTRLDLNYYGKYKVCQFKQLEYSTRGRTLFSTYQGSYLFALEVDYIAQDELKMKKDLCKKDETGNKLLMIMLGKINDDPLGVFQSNEIYGHLDSTILIPEIATVNPVSFKAVVLSSQSRSFDLYFFYLDTFMTIDSGMIDRLINQNPSSSEIQSEDSEIRLNLDFSDVEGNSYRELKSIRRDLRFLIDKNISIKVNQHFMKGQEETERVQDNRQGAAKNQKEALPWVGPVTGLGSAEGRMQEGIHGVSSLEAKIAVQDYGLVSSAGLVCSGEKEGQEEIIRKADFILQCQDEEEGTKAQYKARLQRELRYLTSLNINQNLTVPLEIYRVTDWSFRKYPGLFLYLEKLQIILFRVTKDFKFEWIVSIRLNEDSTERFFKIRNVLLKDNQIYLAVFCFNQRMSEFRYYFDVGYLDGKENSSLPKEIILNKSGLNLYTVSLPQKIAESLSKNLKNAQGVRNYLFVRTEVNFYSIGTRTIIGAYRQTESKSNFELRQSVVNDKYSELKLLKYMVKTYKQWNSDAAAPPDSFLCIQVLINYDILKATVVTGEFKESSGHLQYREIGKLFLDGSFTNASLEAIGADIVTGNHVFVNQKGETVSHNEPYVQVFQQYYIYIITPLYIYEHLLHLPKKDAEPKPFVEQSSQYNLSRPESLLFADKLPQNAQTRYNYAHLCNQDSFFSITGFGEWLMLTCQPRKLTPNQNYIILYRRKPTSQKGSEKDGKKAKKDQKDSDEDLTEGITNPTFVELQVGRESDGLTNELFYFDENWNRYVIKTSVSHFVSLYSLQNTSLLNLHLTNETYASKQIFLNLSNDYEVSRAVITFNDNKVLNILRFILNKVDLSILAVILVWAGLLLLITRYVMIKRVFRKVCFFQRKYLCGLCACCQKKRSFDDYVLRDIPNRSSFTSRSLDSDGNSRDNSRIFVDFNQNDQDGQPKRLIKTLSKAANTSNIQREDDVSLVLENDLFL